MSSSSGKKTACVSARRGDGEKEPVGVGWKTAVSDPGSACGSALTRRFQSSWSAGELGLTSGARKPHLRSGPAPPCRGYKLAAHQPVNLCVQNDGTRLGIRCGLHREREKNLVLVAKIHQRAQRQTLGRGKLHGARRDAGGRSTECAAARRSRRVLPVHMQPDSS